MATVRLDSARHQIWVALIAAALGDIARTPGMLQRVKEAGLLEGLYKGLLFCRRSTTTLSGDCQTATTIAWRQFLVVDESGGPLNSVEHADRQSHQEASAPTRSNTARDPSQIRTSWPLRSRYVEKFNRAAGAISD